MKLQDLFLLEGRHDPYNYKVVFMAGSPGSGKTTVRQKIFGSDMKVVDPDKVASLLQRRETQEQQNDFAAHPQAPQAEKFRQSWLRQGLGMIIDGTGRNFEDYKLKRQQFLEYNYQPAMILVHVPLDQAIANVQKRQAQTGRQLDMDYLQHAWQQVEDNRDLYKSLFGPTYWEVENAGSMAAANINQVARQARRWLNQPAV
jgi:dephospho-CoA kinase